MKLILMVVNVLDVIELLANVTKLSQLVYYFEREVAFIENNL